MKKFALIIAGIIAYWLCVLFAPFVVGIFSYFSMYVTGTGGHIFYTIISLLFQACGCILAHHACFKITNSIKTSLVNDVVCVIILSLAAFHDFYATDLLNFLSIVIAAGALCYIIYEEYKENF